MHHATYGVIAKYQYQTRKVQNRLRSKEEEAAIYNDRSKWSEAERKNYTLLNAGWSAEALVLRRLRRRFTSSKEDMPLLRLVAEAHSNNLNVRYEVTRHEDRIYGLSVWRVTSRAYRKTSGFSLFMMGPALSRTQTLRGL